MKRTLTEWIDRIERIDLVPGEPGLSLDEIHDLRYDLKSVRVTMRELMSQVRSECSNTSRVKRLRMAADTLGEQNWADAVERIK